MFTVNCGQGALVRKRKKSTAKCDLASNMEFGENAEFDDFFKDKMPKCPPKL